MAAGTNAAAQKTEFIARARAGLQGQLAADWGFEVAGDVSVREVSAGDWAYDGLAEQASAIQPPEAAPPSGARPGV